VAQYHKIDDAVFGYDLGNLGIRFGAITGIVDHEMILRHLYHAAKAGSHINNPDEYICIGCK
jgi:hypothetical protein